MVDEGGTYAVYQQPTRNLAMSIFQKILECASLTVISYLAEDALPNATSEAERDALQRIYETDSLDEAYALAHEQLGNKEEADHLRLWMASRQNRPARLSLDELLTA